MATAGLVELFTAICGHLKLSLHLLIDWLITAFTIMVDSRFVPSQWEMVLLCNNVSHWLVANLESALYYSLWMSHSCVLKVDNAEKFGKWWNGGNWLSNSNPTWWRHQIKTFSALLDFSAGNSPVISKFLSQRPVTLSFDVFFKGSLWNSTQNILPIHWKMCSLLTSDIFQAPRLMSL